MIVKKGNNVKVHYVGTLGSGEQFDSSHERGDTLSFTVGSGQMIKGFDAAVVGMKVGETKTVTLGADDAYGPHLKEAIVKAPTTAFPPDFDFQVGALVQGNSPNGQPLVAKILSVEDDGVTLDHNHPLAGEDLTFEIELVECDGVDE
tara:strand:+ start:297 stop:737 length:441 start_codon:yes stop_codon:yes gene_type:complete